MKLHGNANRLETNVNDVESLQFGIGDPEKIIMILRDKMYESKEQTLTQEYTCNARDAMREVGKGNDFEITVPNRLNPVLKIRDFGPGVSPDRMAKVFVLYGATTKSGSNVQTGGFGLGAKSAWSYTDSFTIVTFIDGTKRTYVAHTGASNNGRLDLLSTEKTKEEDGTEIQIGIRPEDVYEFRNAVYRAIYWWKDKPRLKGVSPEEIPTLVRGTMVNDNIEIIDQNMIPSYVADQHDNRPLCIIDGIPYAVTEKLLNKCPTLARASRIPRRRLVLHFGNGIVELAASRESITDSPFSVAALERMGAKALLELQTFVSAGFAKVKSAGEYMDTYLEMSKDFNLEGGFVKYGEYEIKGRMLTNPLLKKVKMTIAHCKGKYGRRVEKITKVELTEPKREISIDMFSHTFFLKNTENLHTQNKRIREYHKKTTEMLIIEPLAGDVASFNQVVKELDLKDFQTLDYPVVTKEERAKITREKTQFCMHCPGYGLDRHTYTTLADNHCKWLYVEVIDGVWGVNGDLRELDGYLKTNWGMRICGLAPRALNMVKGNANFKCLKTWLDNYAPNDKDIKFIAFVEANNRDSVQVLESLKGIKDSFLNEMVKEYKKIAEVDRRLEMPELMKAKVRQSDKFKEFKKNDEKLTKLLNSTYPLANEVGRYSAHKSDLAFYINAKYEANNG